MGNILIIKTNASGDVLRTTVLLQVLKGNIFWITAGYNIPLFPDQYPDLTLLAFENIPERIFSLKFDLIINLEEDVHLAQMVSKIQTQKTVGVYWNKGLLDYSADSAWLFDMSLISKLPASRADELKRKNQFSYQEIICKMIGKTFSGEKYIAYKNGSLVINSQKKIGIEKRVGKTWPNKQWHGYDELEESLVTKDYEIKIFEERDTLRQYMDDIGNCNLIICGDTLAMHVALAYEIPCVAIFNCTSPAEIFDYHILRKIISPLLHEAFYKKITVDEIIHSISVSEVYKAVNKILPSSSKSMI